MYQLDAANKLTLVGPNDFYTSFGYKTYHQVDKGDLVVGNVVSAGWEPNCCQSGYVERRFRVVNGRMTNRAKRSNPATSPRAATPSSTSTRRSTPSSSTPRTNSRRPRFRRVSPSTSGRRASQRRSRSKPQATSTDQAGPVKFKLTAVDTTAGGDLTRTFTGVWTLVYSTAKHQWLLDTAEVQLGG